MGTRTYPLSVLTSKGRELWAAAQQRKRERAWAAADASKARLYFEDRVVHYDDQSFAYQVWLALPKGTKCAFRGAGDTTPVYPWDLVDQL